jgi:hypothetical protein
MAARLVVLLLLAAILPMTAMAQEVLRLCDFETQADVSAWGIGSGQARLSENHVTHGKSSLEIVFDPAGQYHPAYMTWNRPRRDWSGYDALVLDVLNPSDEPMPGFLLIADQAWKDKNASYWNRHNSSTVFAPGRTTWTIPLGGLYRGEAGSRNNDIKRNIDTASIVRLDFGLARRYVAALWRSWCGCQRWALRHAFSSAFCSLVSRACHWSLVSSSRLASGFGGGNGQSSARPTSLSRTETPRSLSPFTSLQRIHQGIAKTQWAAHQQREVKVDLRDT